MKRRRPSDVPLSDASSIKKGRKLNTAENDAKEKAEELLVLLYDVKEALDTFKDADDYRQNIKLVIKCNGITSLWKVLARRAQTGTWSIDGQKNTLDQRFGSVVLGTPLEELWDWNTVDHAIGAFLEAYLKRVNAKPSPSQFARPSAWPLIQNTNSDLLCLRPTNRTGLPLAVLHDVFRKFLIQLNSDMRDRKTVGLARRAAMALCGTMGNHFETKSERSEAFDRCVEPIFSKWITERGLESNCDSSTVRVGSVIKYDNATLAFREVKPEWADNSSDVYLQVTRSYEMYARKVWEQRATTFEQLCSQCIPAFLICVFGPMLFVSGGFYDGRHTIVEPLGLPRFMLEDSTGLRQDQLTRLLYALRKGVDDLQKVISVKQDVDFPLGTPRLYRRCVIQDGSEQSEATLSFAEQQPFYGDHRLLFAATMHQPNPHLPVSVLVKLVKGKYADGVHRLLAKHGLAPKLYGQIQVEGAPTAYVMEALGSSWETLHDVLQKSKGGCKSKLGHDHKEGVRLSLKLVLDLLQCMGFVHGDMRPNNIMVQVDEQHLPSISSTDGVANVRIVDFDWAGSDGVVFYPDTRNDEIDDIKWPGMAGGPIEMGHDGLLVASWWKHRFNNEEF